MSISQRSALCQRPSLTWLPRRNSIVVSALIAGRCRVVGGHIVGFRTGQAAVAAAFGVALALALACNSADHGTGPTGSATQVTVTPDSTAVILGNSQTLKAVARDASGNTMGGVQFFWSSSNSGIATVDQSGVVSSKSVGTANIAASTQGVSGVAAITVVSRPITSVVVGPNQATLRVSTTLQLTDTALDGGGAPITSQPATWASNNTSVATVNGSGLVVARAVGTARISATVAGITGAATITVTLVPVVSIAITPQGANVYVHQTTQLTATPEDSAGDPLAGRPITWKSLATGIATVTPAGLVTGVAAGAAVIQATAQGVIGEDALKVTTAPVSSVVLSPATSQVFIGQTEQLTAVVTNATGAPIPRAPVAYSSSTPSVATVNPSTGVVTGVGAGITTITGTSGGKSGQAAVAVFQVPVGSITIKPADTTIAANGTARLRVTVIDSLGHVVSSPTVTWSSTPAGRVSNTGVVTPQPSDTGSAIVVQTVSGSKSATAVVNVSLPPPVPVASVTVLPADTTIAASQTAQLRVTVVNAAGQTIASPTVTWSSTPVGRVSGSGLVTPQPGDTGTAIAVVATSGGVSGTAMVNVSVPPPPQVASVTVVPLDTTITVAQTVQLQAVVMSTLGQPISSPVVTWTSSPRGRVSPTGLVTPQVPDIGNIITVVATSGGQSDSGTVDVAPIALPGPARTGQSPASASR